MKHKVVMTWVPEGFVERGVLGDDYALELTHCEFDAEKLASVTRDAEAIAAVGTQPFSRRILEGLERCRLIAVVGIGYDGVDIGAATELGICVANNPFYCVEELAEHSLAFMLACARRLMPLDHAIRLGRWTSVGTPEIKEQILAPIRRVSSLTLGVVGFGNAGRALAVKARALGMRVIVNAHRPEAVRERAREMGVELVPMEQLLRESDFVSLHAALTESSRRLIGAPELRMMKSTAYLMNTARGGLVDHDALAIALREGQIAGAALDVTEPEPLPLDSPLLALENAILTPHAAYYSVESDVELWQHPFEEVVRVFSGEWPRALLNPSVRETFQNKWGRGG